MTELEEDFPDDEDFDEDDFSDELLDPQSDHERIELLRIALNFPERPGTAPTYCCCTPTDLDELESILKRHLRK